MPTTADPGTPRSPSRAGQFLPPFLLTFLTLFASSSSARLLGAEEPQRVSVVEAADAPSNEQLATELEVIRSKHGVPALFSGILIGDELCARAAVGKRKHGAEDSVTIDDRIHLGSCTKAMTATLIAQLVEEGKLEFDSKLGEIFSEVSDEFDPANREITLWQLMSHRSGLEPNAPWGLINLMGDPPAARAALVKLALKNKVARPIGGEFVYSNVGFTLAGAVAEKVTHRDWEDLMRERIFTPLEMGTAGFGPPGVGELNDEPWGHLRNGDEIQPLRADNPPVIGPAGTAHCSLPDWAKFAAVHLAGERGAGNLLRADTFRTLHTPKPSESYAAGWIVTNDPKLGGRVITHGGSNTMWLCVVAIIPDRNCALLAASNEGPPTGAKAVQEALERMADFMKIPWPSPVENRGEPQR